MNKIAVKTNSDFTDGLIKKGNTFFREKRYPEAIDIYRTALQHYPALSETVSFNLRYANKLLKNKNNLTWSASSSCRTKSEESIFIGIAAIPERTEALEQVIDSLIDQTPRIGVYLNGWKETPSFLLQEKIQIAGLNGPDIGDIGKFFWVESHDGVYFTCDDDLIYPKNYVEKTINKLKSYNYKSAIGWHGSLIKEPFNNYYDPASRRVLSFSSHRPHDTPVHILGTGCSAFHTQEIPLKLRDFIHPNMADIFFSLKGQELNLPFYVIQHEKNEIVEVDGVKENSIYKHSRANKDSKKNTHELQNKFVSNHKQWVLNEFQPLSILIIGRFDAFAKGGIYKSCHLIKTHLTELGHNVSILDTSCELSIQEGSKVDLCWIYPGDPNRPDFISVEIKIKQLQSLGIPVLVNLSYLYEENRTTWIASKIKEYNSNSGTPVFAAVFTETAANDPLLSEVRKYISVVPKTIHPTPYDHVPSFEEREGICLGDATKLGNPKIIGGDIDPWVEAINKRLPHVNLYAYKQYQGKNPNPKITYVPHMQNNFGEWLAHRKLFICANIHLTFEMVACEAQQYGTPTIYRHMPHSLSEYISATGMAVRDPEEMGEMVAWLYNNQTAWEKMSTSSRHNSESKNVHLLDASLEGYLRLTLHRASILARK